jgi:hypothetical protein
MEAAVPLVALALVLGACPRRLESDTPHDGGSARYPCDSRASGRRGFVANGVCHTALVGTASHCLLGPGRDRLRRKPV